MQNSNRLFINGYFITCQLNLIDSLKDFITESNCKHYIKLIGLKLIKERSFKIC